MLKGFALLHISTSCFALEPFSNLHVVTWKIFRDEMSPRYYVHCLERARVLPSTVWNPQQFHSFASCSSAPSGEFCSKTRKQWIARKLRGEFPNRKVINVQKLTWNFASHNGKCKTSHRKILFDNYWQEFEELLELILAWLEMFLGDITFMVLPQPNQFDNLQCANWIFA